MQAIREYVKVKNHRVSFQLPPSFPTGNVEVIVLPAEVRPDRNQQDKAELLELLLNGPTWSKEDVKHFEDTIQEGWKQWKIEGF